MRGFLYLKLDNSNLFGEIIELLNKGDDPSVAQNVVIRTLDPLREKEIAYNFLKEHNPKWYNEDYEDVYQDSYNLLRGDERVIFTSYKFGQNYHTDEEIAKLKRTKPYLFI